MNEQIEIFLKQIELQADEILVCKIMDYIYKCNANEITGLEQKIASLFCRSIACLSQDTITETVKESIIAAFDNIKTMANNSKGTSELRTIYLLNQVYKKDTKAEYDEVVEEEFGDLLDNLERIRILFKLFDEEQKEIFPIRALLFILILYFFNNLITFFVRFLEYFLLILFNLNFNIELVSSICNPITTTKSNNTNIQLAICSLLRR